METLDAVLNGFLVALTAKNLLYVFIGVFMGTVIGVLPGIGPTAGVAILIPLTYAMNPTSALIMMAGIYYGAMYGGSTTSILINLPGESSSIITCLDGYQMTKKGRAGAALAIAAIGSFLAGTVGIIFLSFLAVPLTKLALRFGPAEYFNLMLFAMIAVISFSSKSLPKGLISMIFGLMIATVGIDRQSGQPRYTLGMTELQDGISFVVVVVGLFALGEVFNGVESFIKGEVKPFRLKGKIWLTREEWRRSIKPIIRGGFIGFICGVIPGGGSTIASILSYAVEKKVSKNPEQLGKGAIEGVAGPESANNSSCNGAMVPMLTLGVPGSGTTAILLAAMISFGLQPGPLLFKNHPDLVWGLIDSMYVGNLMLMILNLPFVRLFVQILYIPKGILLPLILGIVSIGLYCNNTSTLDLYMGLLFGVLGYVFRKLDIPIVPLVMAVVLGGRMEQSFRQAMTISEINPMIFVKSSISAFFLVLTVLAVMLPILLTKMNKWKKAG